MSRQNPDGGWSYIRGVSWTEPTVYAVLSLTAAGERAAAGRGLEWLRRRQLSDGGWAPQAAIDDSCWVTALAALIPPEQLGKEAHGRAIAWLVRAKGEESTTAYRVRQWLLGNTLPKEDDYAGWPWTQDAAAWVAPTSLALLALGAEQGRNPRKDVERRIGEGRQYLLRRMCAGGGWNHGSVRALGYESAPYPETTGLALAALRGTGGREVDASIAVARRFLAGCRTADGYNWLRLGLLAHGALVPGCVPAGKPVFRTVIENAVDVLATQAESGRNAFWAV
ncbi:MAG: terpene cyclase/mutase family protein [Acidobacteriota bacterium]|nr:terpene cyclase/mutase family protein [Acidobacteriota bacterium]